MIEYIVDFGDKSSAFVGLAMAEVRGHGAKLREEIVRCKDCIYHELQTVSYSNNQLSVCTAEWCEGAEGDNPLVEPYGFCKWSERKGDAE